MLDTWPPFHQGELSKARRIRRFLRSDVRASPPSGDIMHTLQFTSLDWSILIGYFLILAIAGYASTRRNMQHADDYFLASHRPPTWQVAIVREYCEERECQYVYLLGG